MMTGLVSVDSYDDYVVRLKTQRQKSHYKNKEVAIDSRLSPAKIRWRQPAVSSELSLVTAS